VLSRIGYAMRWCFLHSTRRSLQARPIMRQQLVTHPTPRLIPVHVSVRWTKRTAYRAATRTAPPVRSENRHECMSLGHAGLHRAIPRTPSPRRSTQSRPKPTAAQAARAAQSDRRRDSRATEWPHRAHDASTVTSTDHRHASPAVRARVDAGTKRLLGVRRTSPST
jgi:hypothetical protein